MVSMDCIEGFELVVKIVKVGIIKVLQMKFLVTDFVKVFKAFIKFTKGIIK